RNLASIAAVSEPGRARDYYARAAALDPSDVIGMFQNGWYQQQAGQLDAAQAAYARVLTMGKPGQDDLSIFSAQLGTGEIQQQRGNLAAALATYQGAQAVAVRLLKANPGSVVWRHNLSTCYEKIGDVQEARGDLSAALGSYQARLVDTERAAKSRPGNTF